MKNLQLPGVKMAGIHKDQKGLAILSLLAVILVITLYGTTSFINIKNDMQHTFKNFDAVKAGYAADAAMAWAITMAQQEPAFSCPTHMPDGVTVYAYNAQGKVPDDCTENPDFTNDKYKFFTNSTAGVTVDAYGWLQTSLNKANGDETLTGADFETLKFKMWIEAANTFRISAMGIVNGDTTTIQLVGDISQ